MRKVSAVVLAAGLSSRFGGPNKVLAPWRGRPMVRQVVDTLGECGLPVTVVTGRDAKLVQAAVAPASTAFNARFEEGMGTSIACGVASLGSCDGILIALADMPELRADVVSALLSAFQSAPEEAIVVPIYDAEPDRPGHPVLFSAKYRSELQALTGDQGARAILKANPAQIIEVPVTGRLDDIDRSTDLEG